MTSVLYGSSGQCQPLLLFPQERTGTYCTEGWVGLEVSLDEYGKTPPSWGSNPRVSSP
jgi:hypothetical protein